MRIDSKLPLTTPGVTPRRGTTRGFSLDAPAEEARGAAAGSVTSSALGGIDSLLVLQAEEDPAQRRRRVARRGSDILDVLDTLKAALLGGRVQVSELARLQALLQQRRETSDDPRLDEVIAHIELRAAVELAKLGR
jgi:hypothetical protein